LEVVNLPTNKQSFVLPRRRVAERSFAGAPPCRLARDDERLPAVVVWLRFVAFATLHLTLQ
jgi:hypothetical protein